MLRGRSSRPQRTMRGSSGAPEAAGAGEAASGGGGRGRARGHQHHGLAVDPEARAEREAPAHTPAVLEHHHVRPAGALQGDDGAHEPARDVLHHGARAGLGLDGGATGRAGQVLVGPRPPAAPVHGDTR